MLGIIAAMPAELASFRQSSLPWPMICAGIGPTAAARAAETLVTQGIGGLISWGTAGALEPKIDAGRLLLYAQCVDQKTGMVFETDKPLLARFRHALDALEPLVCNGLTSDMPVTQVTEKIAFHERYACAAVDMESSAIGGVAHKHGLPFIVVRAIVDPAIFTLPSSALAGLGDPEGALWRVLGTLYHHPLELGALIRLALWYRRALRTLRIASTLLDFVSFDLEEKRS